MTDEELTTIYNEANGITIKRPPITTQRIFAAMRLMRKKTKEDCAKVCEAMSKDAGRIGRSTEGDSGNDCAEAIRMRSNAALRGDSGLIAGVPLESTVMQED